MMSRRPLLLSAAITAMIAAGCDPAGSPEPLEPLQLGPEPAAMLSDADDLAADERPRAGVNADATFEIEMHNNTSGQWFSPCLCAVHHPAAKLFKDGRPASTGMATFAEDGFNGVYAQELRQHPWVYSVLECAPGLTPPGGSRVETLEGPAWARLTCGAMPVTTNDVLTVVHRETLPWASGASEVHDSVEWDLGSEEDNYSPDFIPLDSLDLDEGGSPTVLSFFARAFALDGVLTAEGTMEVFDQYLGSEDFPAHLYGWTGSASTWTITRIN